MSDITREEGTTLNAPQEEAYSRPSEPRNSGAKWGEKLPISVHILTFNSAATVERTLESVQECEEILVIDGGSKDKTLDLAEKFNARIFFQWPDNPHGGPIEDFAAVRNIGLNMAQQPWILSLDSDEFLSTELKAELREAVQGKPAAYFVPRKYVLKGGRIVDYATTYPNERLYFFHRNVVEQWIKPVHERPQLKEGAVTKHFKGASLAPIGSVEEYKEKNLRYLQIEQKKITGRDWGFWLKNRVLHTLRSRAIALMKLFWIWCIPHRGTRLPLRHELMRFWYGWKLIVVTCPLNRKKN